ncbi:MAG: mannosyltransferase [Myxococcaceae bacterium]
MAAAVQPTDPTKPRVPPIALVAVLALIPALHAVILLGRIHPDEVYQALEPAFWRATGGTGVLAWEWQTGLRNWATPLVLSAFLKLSLLLHLDNPRAYRVVLELPQYALHLASLMAVYRFALRRLGKGSEGWAVLASALVGLHGLTIIFAGRTMSESFSASFLLLAVEALDRSFFEGENEKRAGLLGGLYLGLSVVARYGSGVVVVALMVYLLGARKFRTFLFAAISGVVVALALGLLDFITWNEWFHSLRAYLQFNVLSGQAAQQFGQSPWSFYVPWFFRELPFWFWLGMPVAFFKLKPKLSAPLFGGALYLLAIFATPHKEERFLYPGLLLLAMAAAPGVAWLGRALRAQKRIGYALAAVALVVGLAPLQYSDWPELRADQTRAIVYATRGDATGLLIVNEGVWGAGGFFYIGRNIPWGVCDFGTEPRFIGAMRDPRINRAVTFEDRAIPELTAAGFHEIAKIGRETVFAR